MSPFGQDPEMVVIHEDLEENLQSNTYQQEFAKIQADKKEVMDELNTELLNQVISKTKSTIKTNKDYQNKVSSKLLQGL
jgi:hypothetical protein